VDAVTWELENSLHAEPSPPTLQSPQETAGSPGKTTRNEENQEVLRSQGDRLEVQVGRSKEDFAAQNHQDIHPSFSLAGEVEPDTQAAKEFHTRTQQGAG